MHTIPFFRPDITEAEIVEAADTLRSGWITTGKKTKLFEKRLQETVFPSSGKAGSLICLNSATAAEELNLRVWGIRPGDEVIVPAFTYTATASAAIHCGATIRLIDIQKDGDPDTHAPEMDYNALHETITEKTKAVIPVDYGGILCDYETICAIVSDRKESFCPVADDETMLGHTNHVLQSLLGRVAVVADSAHALGAYKRIRDKWVSSAELADFTSYSLHAVKNLTTAEGGIAAWKQEDLYPLYSLLSLHGQDRSAESKTFGNWEYDIIGPWFKYNMTDLAASVGLGQLKRLSDMQKRREEIVGQYDSMCERLGLIHLNHTGVNHRSNCHLYPVRIPGINEEMRNNLIQKLAEKGVETNVHYKPLPMLTAYRDERKHFPNSYNYYQNLITLPLYSLLTDDEVMYICECIQTVL